MNDNEGTPRELPRLKYWLSRPFWIFDDAIKLAYGVLDTDAPLPPFDFMGTMDTLHADEDEIVVLTGAMVEGVVKRAQRYGLTSRSTPKEWIEFFGDERLPGYAAFKQAMELMPGAEAVGGSDFQLAKSAEPEEMRHRLWSNADRSDKGTWPKKDDAVKLLMNEYGLSKTLAERTDTLLRPKWAKSRGRPSNDEKG